MTRIDWAELKVRDLAGQQRICKDFLNLPVTARNGAVDSACCDPQAQVPHQAQPRLFDLAFLLREASRGWLAEGPSDRAGRD